MTTPTAVPVRPSTCHVLKSWPASFQPIAAGAKHSELRQDDRGGFSVGDLLLLQEWDPERAAYTGQICLCLVTHVDGFAEAHTPSLRTANMRMLSVVLVRVVE